MPVGLCYRSPCVPSARRYRPSCLLGDNDSAGPEDGPASEDGLENQDGSSADEDDPRRRSR